MCFTRLRLLCCGDGCGDGGGDGGDDDAGCGDACSIACSPSVLSVSFHVFCSLRLSVPSHTFGSSACSCLPTILTILLLNMAHLDASSDESEPAPTEGGEAFAAWEYRMNFPRGVEQPRWPLSCFALPQPLAQCPGSDFNSDSEEPQPKFPQQVHAGGEDEFVECLHAYPKSYTSKGSIELVAILSVEKTC